MAGSGYFTGDRPIINRLGDNRGLEGKMARKGFDGKEPKEEMKGSKKGMGGETKKDGKKSSRKSSRR